MLTDVLQEIHDAKDIKEVIMLLEKYGCLSPHFSQFLKEAVVKTCLSYL